MNIKIKKENIIIIFYILYFTWLFTITYLTPDISLLNIFTVSVLLFYFVFLGDKGDIFWFTASSIFGILTLVVSFSGWSIEYNQELIKYIPLWIPLSWGVTVLALKRFFNILNVRIK